MNDFLFLDLETFGAVPLKQFGVYRYAADPSFMILMCSFAMNDDPIQRIELDDDALRNIPGLLDPNVIKCAHNAGFERVCFSKLFGLPLGEYLPPEEWHDTAAVAASKGYPRDLDRLAKALGGEQKSSAGTRLINLFSKPNRKGERTLPEEKPEQWAEFGAYCDQDVETHRDAHKKLGGWQTRSERDTFMTSERINDRGMRVDVDLAKAGVLAGQENRMIHELEISHISGIINPGSTQQMHKWFEERKFPMPNLKKETVEARLKDEIPADIRRVLELRQELAGTAIMKFAAMTGGVLPDDRIRGGFVFHGAHTGRWSGRGAQPQNLPRASLVNDKKLAAEGHSGPEIDAIRDLLEAEAILELLLGNGADAETLKALVRSAFVGPFAVSDYSAIEARVLAWLAGEEWVLQAFREGREIYTEMGKRMGGLDREEGKIAVLALGYNGGVGSLKSLGGGNIGNDAKLRGLVGKYRKANPRITRMWSEMEEAFVRGGGKIGAGIITAERDGNTRKLRLPSGRALHYHNVRVRPHPEYADRRDITFSDNVYGRGSTYGGRLSENVTQAVARDLLAAALVKLEAEGFRTVAHVHDEVVVESSDVDRINAILCDSPAWAKGLPVGAAGFTTERYRKG